MPRITIELDDETLDLLRKAAPPAGVSVVAHATNMPELPPWHTDVMLTERVMSRLWEALAEQGPNEVQSTSAPPDRLAAAVDRGVIDARTAQMIRDQIRDYRWVFDRLAE